MRVATTLLWSLLMTTEPADSTVTKTDESSQASTEAARLRETAEAHFFENDLDGALKAFEQAHELAPHPTDLFNLGRIHEERGDLSRALSYYEEFVRQPHISLDQRATAAERIQVLRVLVEKEPSPASDKSSKATKETPIATRSPSNADWEGDKTAHRMVIAGSTLAGIGAALAIGGGVGFGIAARRNSDTIDSLLNGSNTDRLSLSEAEDVDALGKDYEILQITSIAAGGAIALAGAAVLTTGLIKQRRERLKLNAIAPHMTPTFAGLTTHWRF